MSSCVGKKDCRTRIIRTDENGKEVKDRVLAFKGIKIKEEKKTEENNTEEND